MHKTLHKHDTLKARLLAILAGLPPKERKAVVAELSEVVEAIASGEQSGSRGQTGGLSAQSQFQPPLSGN